MNVDRHTPRAAPRAWALAAALCVASATSEVHGERRCPPIAGGDPRLAAHDAEARLAFIRARLRHDAWRARQWSWGFGTSYALLATGSVAVAPAFDDRGVRVDTYVGGASALVGLGLITLGPLKVMRDHDMLEAHIATLGAHVDRCRLLALAETMLVRDAKNEAFGRGWFTHTGNALLGVAALLVLGLGFGRWSSGAINGVGSIAIGELMINLQPGGLTRDLRRYRAGDLRPPQRRRRRH